MKLFFSRYELSGKNSQPSQAGALLKLLDDGFFGVADICPKTRFGDQSLEDEIKNRGPLFKRALELATEDLEARKKGVTLLQNKPVANNVLVTGYELNNPQNEITYKIKADENFEPLFAVLNRVKRARLDFNSSLSAEKFEIFLNRLTPETISKIEYIEDPTVVSPRWREWNRIVPLAFDLQNNQAYEPQLASVCVIKPSRQAVPADMSHVVLTSAMDHPVGVAHGLRFAQKLATKVSGFLTLGLYDDLGFNKYFEESGTLLNFSALALSDSGIGMTAELEKLSWTPHD